MPKTRPQAPRLPERKLNCIGAFASSRFRSNTQSWGEDLWQQATDGANAVAEGTGQLRKILHIDDDADIREIVAFVLQDVGGYDLLQCDSGRSALVEGPAFEPDLIILDVMMPDADGKQVLTDLRDVDGLSTVPAIFMTAKANDDFREELIEAGAIDVIAKPFDPVELPGQVAAAWEKRSQGN